MEDMKDWEQKEEALDYRAKMQASHSSNSQQRSGNVKYPDLPPLRDALSRPLDTTEMVGEGFGYPQAAACQRRFLPKYHYVRCLRGVSPRDLVRVAS